MKLVNVDLPSIRVPLNALLLCASFAFADAAMAQMDHSNMNAQGGSAPADARDPHAYADGYTLTEGPYAQPGPRQLKLADEHSFWSVLGDRLEYQAQSQATVYDLQGWYGTTYDRLVIKAEGDIVSGAFEESSTDLLWGHAISAYFDTQLGVRLDQYDEGTNREWLALGVQGLAPYWFELDVAAYIGNNGRAALSAQAEYELLLTQRLILQPRAELNAYSQADPENRLGSGLSDLALGVRLRYEFNRQLAPYIGVEWTNTYGGTADYRRVGGKKPADTQFVAGLRFWF
ncbi:copper resistance protein B [Simiduia agarivorans]|uniref:Copper resistance protein B n=1 Tax=Simiduia agarivorans (strain DSM 21679 / JCM 13881 / BCRC 17597 / SA1) TaxID=1117647 RepID=K4KHX7_SIMAS|nr:copper resistance protein B [Simiduia agarivorans]AFU97790.1 putative copper resistance protein B [Simiduia agarivorans SA1 = DSM 21679]